MKRIISFILIFSLTLGVILSLASCGGGGDGDNPKASDPVALPLGNWTDAVTELGYVDSHTAVRTVEISHTFGGVPTSESRVSVKTVAGLVRNNVGERNVVTVTKNGVTATSSYGYRDGYFYYSGADDAYKSQLTYTEYLAFVSAEEDKVDLAAMNFTDASMIYKRDGTREIRLSGATGDLGLFDGILAELSALAGVELRITDVRAVAIVGRVPGDSCRYPYSLILTPTFAGEGVELPTVSIRLDFSNIGRTSVELTDDFDGLEIRENLPSALPNS